MINMDENPGIEPLYSFNVFIFYIIIAHFTKVLLTTQSFPPKSDRKHFETYVKGFFADSLKFVCSI